MKHTSPKASKAHQILHQEAKKAGIDENEVRKLLWLINAHDGLVSFVKICQNLSKILALLEQHLDIQLDRYGIEHWPEIVAWVVKNQDSLVEKIGENFDLQPKKEDDNPILSKGATRNASYAALWNTHELVEERDHFYLIVGHLLLANIKLMKERIPFKQYECYGGPKEINGYPNTPSSASLAIRTLSKKKAMVVLKLLDPYTDQITFAKDINEINLSEIEVDESDESEGQESIEETLVTHLGHYCRFIPKVYGIRKWVKRRRKKGSRSSGGSHWQPGYVDMFPDHEMLPTDIGDPHDPYENWGSQVVVHEIPEGDKLITKGRAKQLLDIDVDPAEIAGEDELYLVEHDCKAAKKGVAGLIYAAKGQVRHIVMQNQLLPWRYRELTISEIAELLKYCSKVFRQLMSVKSWNKELALRAEAIALLHASLWTGSTLKRAMGLRIITDGKTYGCELGLYCPQKSDDEKENIIEWYVRSYFPKYRSRVNDPGKKSRRRTQYVCLPDIAGGAQFIIQLMNRDKYRNKKIPFGRKIEEYKKAIRLLIGEMNRSERITERKIESFLFHRIASVHGDITQAVALTGQNHVLAQSRIFYSTPKMNHLRDVYIKSVEGIINPVYKAANIVNPKHFASVPRIDNRHVGSRLCAKTETVSSAISNLKVALERMKHYKTRSEFVHYHNLYTFYTVLMVGYATGCRAIITPFIPLMKIDLDTGLSSLADKDGPDHHKSRLVWVPEDVVTQIRSYEAHRDTVLASYFDALKKRRRTKQVPDCIFLTEEPFGWEEVKPATLAPFLEEFLPLPANAHRRFIRTEMMEAGCNCEVIDAYMGHWGRGEEPWGKYSSFSFNDYVIELRNKLVPLLNKLGWSPIRSALASNLEV